MLGPVRMSESRSFHYLLFAATLAVVVSPALAGSPKDDFPLSTYPMFASNKDTKTTVDQAVGLGESEPVVLGPRFMGTDEVLQARAVLSRAVRSGHASTLCAEIAARVAADPALADVRQIEIRNVTHDSIRYFAEKDRSPLAQRTHVRCAVAR
jgi:hypothetical protein